jgi:tetratricopeptide (TPR) repeat protein
LNPYGRQDVLRILRLNSRQLGNWERAGLVASKESYSFQDLVQLRQLRDLRASQFTYASIRDSIAAMRLVSGMENPLLEAVVIRDGSRLAFRHRGTVVDPIRRQLLFDFDPISQQAASIVPVQRLASQPGTLADDTEAQGLFFDAVQAEESGKVRIAMDLYNRILTLAPDHAPASINLGTLHYNQHHYQRAEQLYRRATLADPNYALAFFDLGNVLDELKRPAESVVAYERALEIAPNYADAHYNLALAYDRSGEGRRALAHWQAYLRMDPIGPWANHARNQIRILLKEEGLEIVHRGRKPASVTKPMSLLLVARK